MKEAETLLFKFLWGTATFPLARAVAHRPVEEGGLDFPSVTLKFLAGFLSFNFGAYRTTEVQMQSSSCPAWTLLFARHWDRHDWFRQWWREGFTPRAVSTVTKLTGPDFCWDLYAQIKRYKVQAEWLRDVTGPIRCLKRNVYGRLLDINCYRPQSEKNLTKVALSDYLKKQEFPITYFTDRRIPYSLWDIRWRFYHQIYKLKVSLPWVPVERQLCPRAHCEKQMLTGGAPQRETYEHFLKLCPGARDTWAELARKMDWPELKEQQWESIVSGIEPEGGIRGPGKPVRRKRNREGTFVHERQHWLTPWSTVRLINLTVILSLIIQRQEEIKLQSPYNLQKAIKFILGRIKTLSEVEKGRLPTAKWKKFWPWMADGTPAIT